MKSKIVCFIIAAVMITSIFVIIPQNAGQSSWNVGQSVEREVSNPQNVGESSSSGIGGLADSPWPMFRGNNNRTGLSLYDTSGNTGQFKWFFQTGDRVSSSPTIGSDGTIYVGSWDNKLYAINPDGTEKWNFETGYRIGYSSPTIGFDGTIYVGSWDNKLYALNPDGTEKWNFVTGDFIDSSPIIGSDGTIYIGSYDDKFYAINPDGTEKWNMTIGGDIYSSATIGSNGIIYVGSSEPQPTFHAFYPNGSEKWCFFTGDDIYSSPALGSDGTIFIGSFDNKIYAINPNGSEQWNFSTGNRVYSSPAIGSDGTIYIGSYDDKFYAINQDGTEKWHFKADDRLHSSAAIGADGTIYIGSDNDKKIYAINPNGTEKWNFWIGNPIWSSSPAIDSDGTIYIGSWDGKLYAIGPSNIPPIANAGIDHTINEGDTVQLDESSSYDPDGAIISYQWDFDSSDGLWWETGASPDVIGINVSHTYGDDGLFIATLRVTDNDNLSATDTCNITVQNIDPTVSIESATMNLEIGLRVAGRKYNNVSMTLYEDGDSLGSVSIERLPGSPNVQMAWIPVSIDFSKSYSANVTFIPEDPPNVGANPVWIYLKSANGTINQIHHTFNVQQSKKRNSQHWNHVEPWEVELNQHFIGLGFEITSHVTDPGSDDETLTYTYGSQIVTVTHLNNPPNPDPYPSPEVNPVDVMDTTTLIYKGSGTVTLVVKDDDNIRLGVGQGSDSFDI